MKTEKQYKKYLHTTIAKWIPILGLESHLIGIQKDDKEQYLACRFRYPYLDAQILWTDNSFKKWQQDPDQEHEIVHELCHIITDPLYAKATTQWVSKVEVEDERERLTDRIAVIVYKNFKGK